MGELIEFGIIDGKKLRLSRSTINAAYEWKKHEYQMQDCIAHIRECAFGNPDGDGDTCEEDEHYAEFVSKYGISFDETVELADIIIDRFNDDFDCNFAINDMWRNAIHNTLTGFKR